MIKILSGKTDKKDIFNRVAPKIDVSAIVADIIEKVKKRGR